MRHLAALIALASLMFGGILYASNVPVAHVTLNYSSTNVGPAAYVPIATVSASVGEAEIFDSSGNQMILAASTMSGTTTATADQIYIVPGGNGRVPMAAQPGTRFSVKGSPGTTATAGSITVNFYK